MTRLSFGELTAILSGRPVMTRIIDLFCGAGGVTKGLVLAGNEVIGVDINPALRADYLRTGARKFICMDALEFLARHGDNPGIDFYWASPPCQRYSKMTRCRPGQAEKYPDLVAPVREALNATGRPWVMENVEGAPLENPVMLCSFMFGRPMYRHRLFETGGGFTLAAPPEPPEDIRPVAEAACAVLGFACPDELLPDWDKCGWPHPVENSRGGKWRPGTFISVTSHSHRGPANAAMGIGWMTRREDVGEAIPPCMAEWVGRQL